jgi:hypothetical protein
MPPGRLQRRFRDFLAALYEWALRLAMTSFPSEIVRPTALGDFLTHRKQVIYLTTLTRLKKGVKPGNFGIIDSFQTILVSHITNTGKPNAKGWSGLSCYTHKFASH